MLRPLVLSVCSAGDLARCTVAAADGAPGRGRSCGFCGGSTGRHCFEAAGDPEAGANVTTDPAGSDRGVACALCFLAQHLERPRIDEEARLIWLPEMSQPALNVMIRAIHARLRALGERLDPEARPLLCTNDRRRLYHARIAVAERGVAATARLGTDKPSDLGHVLLHLSACAYDRRAKLLGGLRLLPTGRFFDGGSDIYPAIVDGWRAVQAALSARRGSRPPGA